MPETRLPARRGTHDALGICFCDMDIHKSHYSIQEAADRLGIPIQKLRRWDAAGVLVAERTSGGHRRYDRATVDALARSAGPPPPSGTDDPGRLQPVRKALHEKSHILRRLADSDARWRDLVATSNDLVWCTDTLGTLTFLGGDTTHLPGLDPTRAVGRPVTASGGPLLSPLSVARVLARLRRGADTATVRVRLRDGGRRRLLVRAREFFDSEGHLLGIRGTARDLGLSPGLAAGAVEALTDALTGLGNRASLRDRLARCAPGGGVLALLDLDRFFAINRSLGEGGANQVLVLVGEGLREVCGSFGAEAFRCHGDTFAVLAPDDINPARLAGALLERVRRCSAPMPEGATAPPLSACTGVVAWTPGSIHAQEVFMQAEAALLRAKRGGLDQVVVADREEQAGASDMSATWAMRLRHALAHDRLVLFAQPVVRLEDGEPIHYEVLARLEDESGTLISPGIFMGVAESLGLAQEIDLQVVRKVLAFLAAPERQGRRIRLFVNLSPASIADPGWVGRLQALLGDGSASRGRLVFEIPEAAALADLPRVEAFVDRVKGSGCQVALDDFGSGMGAFARLRRVGADYVKIDASFVTRLAEDERFARALCDVGQSLSPQLIAKGVESASTAGHLASLSVVYAQGFHFEAPFPLEGRVAGALTARH